jgi:hypothetical protein
LAGPFFYNRTDPVFFQSLGEKNKKQKFVTRNQGDPMGVSGFGSFFCLWAVRARSNRVVGDTAYDRLHRNRAGGVPKT